ncbi:TVP38/TMEM64 family protein [Haloarchaeobius litoreus]|uniref:TVP38/TMEM64 family protein n=1 Tax=Haloarchaeobius litoreus TaxID=755306 RepID=A0ABD6DJC9_9EURY|nr:VTT domain-containing protein [Haloarchaeobius litoreus]
MRVEFGRRALAGAVVACVVVASLLTSPETALEHLATIANDPVAFAAVLVGLYIVRPFLAWPATLLAVVVGYGYGVALGVPVALAFVVGTSLIPFYATRWFDGGTLEPTDTPDEPDGGLRGHVERYFGATGHVRGVTAARLVPIPADIVSCTAAVSGVPTSAFVAGTLLGELPWTLAAVVVGSSAKELSTGGLGSVGLPLGVVTVAAAMVLLAGPAYRSYAQSTE